LEGTGEKFTLPSDVVFKAIGQAFAADDLKLEMRGGCIAVDDYGQTSIPGVWAGGDCVDGGLDLTVAAVEDGKVAANAIDRALRASAATAGVA
jgi:glutamate synthase (NADPH/NADH) small chain